MSDNYILFIIKYFAIDYKYIYFQYTYILYNVGGLIKLFFH